MSSRRHDERGAVAVIVAVCALTLFVLAALVVDLGLARDTRRQSQNAADASALAAVNALYPTACTVPAGGVPPCVPDAVASAKSYAASNYGVTDADWATCTAPPAGFVSHPGSPTCISFDSLTQPSRVWVVMPTRNVKTGLGALAGVSSVPVGARARAVLRPGGGGPCGLCVVGGGVHDLQNGDGIVTGASIYFNGSLSLNPNGSVTSNGGTVTVQGSGPTKGAVTPSPTTGTGVAIEDPMAGLTLPPDMTGLTFKTPANICTGGPGIYLNPTGSNCVLSPGLYVFIGGTLGGNAGIVANNVTMYFTCRTGNAPRACGSGETGATLDLYGNGDFTLNASPSAINKAIPRVAIAFDRQNTATVRMVGNGLLHITGSIYLKSGTLDMRGNGCTAQTSVNSLIVVDDLAFSGTNACLRSDYTQDSNYQVPPGDPALDQ